MPRRPIAARPPASQLLPENTLAVLSVPDTKDLAAKFMNTDLGRMTQDAEMKPLVTQLYSSFSELVATVQEQIGLSLPEILALPQGEATVAMVAVTDSQPAFIALFDAGDQIANTQKFLQRGIDAMLNNGFTKRDDKYKNVSITIIERGGVTGQSFAVCEKEGTIVAGTNPDVVKGILGAWSGDKSKTLADNYNFGAIMNRCKGAKDAPPQIIWFVDPINFMRSIAEQQTGIRVAVAMLPLLGLDGLSGIGGSMIYDDEQYDSVIHTHLLLENPRSGIIKMIALEPGVSKPESWVPADVAAYQTVHWKFDTTLKTLTSMVDSMAGPGALDSMIEQRLSGPSGLDLRKQIIPALEGRVTHLTWIEKPITQASTVTLVALKLKDVETVKTALDGLLPRHESFLSKESSAGKKYFKINIPVSPNMPDASQIPVPCFGIVDDYLIITNRISLYEKVLLISSGGGKTLADDLEFKLINGKIQKQTDGTKPVMLGFNRPEESIRYYYDLVTSERTKEALKNQAERNGFFKSLDTSLEKTPLPAFEVIQRYLAPGGSVITDDDTGLHYMGFTLRRKSE